MTRQEIEREVKNVFQREFEIDNPDMDADLRETYEFDSIDAIELLLAIETFLNTEITQEEKTGHQYPHDQSDLRLHCRNRKKRNLFTPA